MLFLVLTSQDAVATAAVPSAQLLTTYRRACDYLAHHPNVQSAFTFVGERRSAIVLNVAGPVEAHTILQAVPGATLMRFEVHPLLTLDEMAAQIDATLRAISTPHLR